MARNKTETQLQLDIPADLNADQRLEVATRVLQFIHDRTEAGNNVFGRRWSGKAGQYSEGYAKRKGVSTSGPVDLVLSREMLGNMQYFPSKSGPGQITIGFRKGTKVSRKAEGNILGSYGRSPDSSKARPFLDILKKDLNAIVDQVRVPTNDSDS